MPPEGRLFLHAGKESLEKWKQVRKSADRDIIIHPFTGEMINVAVFIALPTATTAII